MVMAAIVTTLLCLPGAALLAGLLFLVGIPFYAFVTFGGTFNEFQGLLAWWAVAFLPALAYTVYVLPWSRREH